MTSTSFDEDTALAPGSMGIADTQAPPPTGAAGTSPRAFAPTQLEQTTPPPDFGRGATVLSTPATPGVGRDTITQGARGYAEGQRIDRYVLEQCLGRGGMGEVWAAQDTDLQRRVAIKFILPAVWAQLGEDARELFRREAQSMARLEHTNVVGIYDLHTSGKYVTLQFVGGGTLTHWLASELHSTRAILDRFIEAGSGLAAAHAAGLVHRDFKPDNVLLKTDGTACVADFGLALLAEDRDAECGYAGTPLYMAPEQHRGDPVDARGDQFSFCVALWMALCGEHPYAGREHAHLSAAVLEGRLRPPPSRTRGEARILKVLERGLQRDPEERFTSMDELVARLQPRRLARPVITGGLLLLLLLVAGVTNAVSATDPPQPCARVAVTDQALWSPAIRQRLVATLRGAGAGMAMTEAERAAGLIDSYASRIVDLRQQACHATHVEQTQSTELYDRKMICLNGSREAARLLIDRLGGAPPAAEVKRALRAAERLPSLDDCANDEQLMSSIALPVDPVERARADSAESERQRALVLANLGDTSGAQAKLHELEVGLGDTLPQVRAKLACMQASYHEVGAQFDDAAAAYDRCAALAATANDQDLLVTAWIGSMGVEGFYKGDHRRALDRGSMISTALAGGKRPAKLRALFYQNHALLLENAGDDAAALRDYEIVIPVFRDEMKDSLGLAAIYNNMSSIYSSRRDFTRALELQRSSLALRASALGPTHRDVLTARANIASTLINSGAIDEGMQGLRALLPEVKASLGPKHPLTGIVLANLARQLEVDSKFSEGLALATEALAIRIEVNGPDHVDTARAYKLVGGAYAGLGQLSRAHEALATALAIYRKAQPGQVAVATMLDSLASVASRQGNHREALRESQEAVALLHALPATSSEDLATMLTKLAERAVSARQPVLACTAYQRARTVLAAEPAVARSVFAGTGKALARCASPGSGA